MEKFRQKRPIKADYIRKYVFQGDAIWRWDLLKYNEAKNAWKRRQANIKEYQKSQRSTKK